MECKLIVYHLSVCISLKYLSHSLLSLSLPLSLSSQLSTNVKLFKKTGFMHVAIIIIVISQKIGPFRKLSSVGSLFLHKLIDDGTPLFGTHHFPTMNRTTKNSYCSSSVNPLEFCRFNDIRQLIKALWTILLYFRNIPCAYT